MIRITTEKLEEYDWELKKNDGRNDEALEELIAKIKANPFGIANLVQEEREQAFCRAIIDIQERIQDIASWLTELNEIVLVTLDFERIYGTSEYRDGNQYTSALIAIALTESFCDDTQHIIIDKHALVRHGRGTSSTSSVRDVITGQVNTALERMFDFEGAFKEFMKIYEDGMI